MSGPRGTENVECWRVRGGADASNERGAALTSLAVKPSLASPQLTNFTSCAAASQPEPMAVPWFKTPPNQPFSCSRPLPSAYTTTSVFVPAPQTAAYPGHSQYNVIFFSTALPIAAPPASAPTITQNEHVQPSPYSSIYARNQNPVTAVPTLAMGQLQIASSELSSKQRRQIIGIKQPLLFWRLNHKLLQPAAPSPRHMRDRTRLSTLVGAPRKRTLSFPARPSIQVA